MVERVSFTLKQEGDSIELAALRYGLLERACRSATRLRLTLLAFGIQPYAVRFVIEGDRGEIPNLVRAIKVGTARSARGRGVAVGWGPVRRATVAPGGLVDAVVWAHRAPLEAGAPGPLASPWSSHRDLLGFRSAPFFDASELRGRVDPLRVHRGCGGGALPTARRLQRPRESLSLLLRLCAALVGVLPADRRSFRLFVHVARARGWTTCDLARALMLTGRRIRQLASTPEPLVTTALLCLADPRLSVVP